MKVVTSMRNIMAFLLLGMFMLSQGYSAMHWVGEEHDHATEQATDTQSDCETCSFIKNFSEQSFERFQIPTIAPVVSILVPSTEFNSTKDFIADNQFLSVLSNKAPPVLG